nr:hypothetical protein [Corynebacterium choanae]
MFFVIRRHSSDSVDFLIVNLAVIFHSRGKKKVLPCKMQVDYEITVTATVSRAIVKIDRNQGLTARFFKKTTPFRKSGHLLNLRVDGE